MKTLSRLMLAATIVGLASACMVRTQTVERPAPATYVATAPTSSVVYYSY